MANQKLEALLNLALESTESERRKSGQLGVGFTEEDNSWELIVKYNGDIGRLGGVIGVEELIAGYAIVTIPERLIDTFTQLEEIEYVEKPKRLYFSTLLGKQASCIYPVTAREPYLTGRGVLIAVIDSGDGVIILQNIFMKEELHEGTGNWRCRSRDKDSGKIKERGQKRRSYPYYEGQGYFLCGMRASLLCRRADFGEGGINR